MPSSQPSSPPLHSSSATIRSESTVRERPEEQEGSTTKALLKGLSFLDRFLAVFVLLAMILGVVIGKFAPNVNAVLNGSTLKGVSIPLVVGLLVMMWPILTKVQYEKLPQVFQTKKMWYQICISLVLNWIVGPFVMLAIAWATLPDLPTYRTGVIMVGLARCIAMVMIWNHLAGGDGDYCAILVIINSVLQIILYSPMSLLFVNVIGGEESLRLDYGNTALAVVIYLGIPLVAGFVTRVVFRRLLGPARFQSHFLPCAPWSLIGLLYIIIIIFAEQATRILDNLGPTFRVFVPMVLYFCIMWSGTFFGVWWFGRRKGGDKWGGSYEMAVVQSFTASSNNFELAIAVCIAIYGVDSDQALAATIGPLVEVPVLLALTWVALYLKKRLNWKEREVLSSMESTGGEVGIPEEQRKADSEEEKRSTILT